jgi:hypothetical protein
MPGIDRALSTATEVVTVSQRLCNGGGTKLVEMTVAPTRRGQHCKMQMTAPLCQWHLDAA